VIFFAPGTTLEGLNDKRPLSVRACAVFPEPAKWLQIAIDGRSRGFFFSTTGRLPPRRQQEIFLATIKYSVARPSKYVAEQPEASEADDT